MILRQLLAAVAVAATGFGQTRLTDGAQSPEDLFVATLRTTLERNCQGCHGLANALSKLDLSTRDGLLRGGARGASIIPGNAGQSLLIHVLEGRNQLQMPPGGEDKKLQPEIVAAFRQWVDGGAPWPRRKEEAAWDYKPDDLWAFAPLRPFDKAKRVDDFVDARLADRGIAALPRADRRTLARRATIDLTGLPPAPDEVDAFVNDDSPQAWARLIDRLLASPRYGERWGRQWLDVVRYADTSGYSNDFERPNAWRYRDYVIRSLNADKPYDQFIREQIAGDELYPGNPEALIATGFLRAGPWEHTAMSVEAITRQAFLDDVTHATAATFLGLTLGCARCHDHKFDPIPTRDYYRMQAVFATTEFARPTVPFLTGENTGDLEGGAAKMRQRYESTVTRMRDYRQQALPAILKKHNVSRPEDLPNGELERAMTTGFGLEPEDFEAYKLFQKHSQLFKESLDRFEPKAFAVSSGPLDDFTDGGGTLKYPRRADYKPATVHILTGGSLQSPAEPVTPGLLSAFEKFGQYPAAEIPQTLAGRRAALANWIANPKNPLTARVMVNRIWQGHFGRGIAADTNNFGKMGKKPTNPELLDWLANYFVQQGWSIKAVHRAIMMSSAYQRASSGPKLDAIRQADPENALLAAFPPRRLEAETVRDSILAVSGELNLTAGGPGVFPQINEDVARQPQHRMGSLAPAYQPSELRSERNRRTIYTFQQRSLLDPLIEVFNGANPDLSCERREESIVPTQSFALFNSQFAHDAALAMAIRLEKEAPAIDRQIRLAFRLAFGREPEAGELRVARKHVAAMTQSHQALPPPAKAATGPLVHKITSELTGETFQFVQQEAPRSYQANSHPSEVSAATRALSDLALILLNSNEFVYVY